MVKYWSTKITLCSLGLKSSILVLQFKLWGLSLEIRQIKFYRLE